MNRAILQILKQLLQSAQICKIYVGGKKLARVFTREVRVIEGQGSLWSSVVALSYVNIVCLIDRAYPN